MLYRQVWARGCVYPISTSCVHAQFDAAINEFSMALKLVRDPREETRLLYCRCDAFLRCSLIMHKQQICVPLATVCSRPLLTTHMLQIVQNCSEYDHRYACWEGHLCSNAHSALRGMRLLAQHVPGAEAAAG